MSYHMNWDTTCRGFLGRVPQTVCLRRYQCVKAQGTASARNPSWVGTVREAGGCDHEHSLCFPNMGDHGRSTVIHSSRVYPHMAEAEGTSTWVVFPSADRADPGRQPDYSRDQKR